MSMDIPDLRNKAEREMWRNDTFCTDKKVAGDMYVEPHSKGRPNIPDGAYEKVREMLEKINAEDA